MSVYGQEAEVRLLASFVPHLSSKVVVDVGAERGSFVAAMLEAGAVGVHAVEPDRDNVAGLGRRFEGWPVYVHPLAAGAADGRATLHRASFGKSGEVASYAHSLLAREPTETMQWSPAEEVEVRALDSLVAEGALPARVGILKVDTEGYDLEVLRGARTLEADVVMIEHWRDLPDLLGPCPWTLDEVVAELEPRGFGSFSFIAHLGEVQIVQWMEATAPTGTMGNLVFLHDRVAKRLIPGILALSSELATALASLAAERAEAAAERLRLLEALSKERDVQAEAAAERLRALEDNERAWREREREWESRMRALEQLSTRGTLRG